MTGIVLDGSGEESFRNAMRAVRSRWRRRVVLEGAVVALAVVLTVVAAVLIVLAVRGVRPGSVEIARIVVWVSIAAATAWWVVRPGLRKVDDARLALYLDEHDPALAQSVLSAVAESRRPVAERLSPSLSRRLITTAAAALDRLELGSVVEQPRTRIAGRRIAALLVGTAIAMVLLPSPWRAAARALLLPWGAAAEIPVRRLAVQPGDIEVGRGSGLDLSATVSGFVPTDVKLRMAIEATGESFELPMLADSGGTRFAIRLVDLQDDVIYWVEADGMASGRHLITVVERPAVRDLGVQLEYPAYTGMAAESFDPGGDIAAVVGTEVTISARVTMPVRGATIRFDDGTTIPMLLGDSAAPVGRFKVERTGFYTVDLAIDGGGVIAGAVRHLVDALPDRAPLVRITAPGRDTRATAVEEVAIAVSADDDYGVRSLELVYTVNGGAEQRASLLRGAPAGTVEPRAVHTLFLEELPLVAGDLVSYHAVAVDGGGNTAQSDLYFLEVRPFSRNYRQAEAGEGGGGGGGGGGAETPGELTTRQRDLVVATFNALRDSATTPPARAREDQTTIAIAQGKLRSDVAGLTTRMVSRGISELDSTFVVIRAALDSAAVAMTLAEDALGRGAVRAATPAQQRALQQLQRADAAYREVEVRLGGQQGGGGGGGGGGGALLRISPTCSNCRPTGSRTSTKRSSARPGPGQPPSARWTRPVNGSGNSPAGPRPRTSAVVGWPRRCSSGSAIRGGEVALVAPLAVVAAAAGQRLEHPPVRAGPSVSSRPKPRQRPAGWSDWRGNGRPRNWPRRPGRRGRRPINSGAPVRATRIGGGMP
ncbi:MAG: DUF4175 family protein [Gemmatimonadales bacterium]|nr:DUF4175 family protein [Gemmatimonadales bacterium]